MSVQNERALAHYIYFFLLEQEVTFTLVWTFTQWEDELHSSVIGCCAESPCSRPRIFEMIRRPRDRGGIELPLNDDLREEIISTANPKTLRRIFAAFRRHRLRARAPTCASDIGRWRRRRRRETTEQDDQKEKKEKPYSFNKDWGRGSASRRP